MFLKTEFLIKLLNYMAVFHNMNLVLAVSYIETKPNTFINIIINDETKNLFDDQNVNFNFPFTSQEKNQLLSYTIHDVINFNFLPWRDNDTDYNVYQNERSIDIDFSTGYFRYGYRLDNPTIAFLIRTTSFNETIATIQKSGYGESEKALFVIETSSFLESDSIIAGFRNNLFQSTGIPFHAPIIFYTTFLQVIGVFCYFCPMKKEQIQMVHGRRIPYDNVLSIYTNLNSNGYGKTLFVQDPFGYTGSSEDTCFKNYSTKRVRTNLFGEHVNCSIEYAWEFGLVGRYFNFTVTFDKSTKSNENIDKWLVQLRLAEAIRYDIPNHYIQTRGAIIPIDQVKLDLMGCQFKADLQIMHFGVATALDAFTWGVIFYIALLYAFISGRISRGLDILWIFFGKPLQCTHKMSSVFFIMLMISMLSYIYQSVMSADSMQLSEFPTLREMTGKGYRTWVVKGYDIAIETSLAMLSNSTKESLNKFGIRRGFFHSRGGKQGLENFYHDVPALFRKATTLKYFISSASYSQVLNAIGKNNIVYMNQDLVCTVYRTNDFVDLPYIYSLRIWSYLSTQMSRFFNLMLENGMYDRIHHLHTAIASAVKKQLQIESANGLLKPNAITLMSAVGTSCLIHCSVGSLLFIWWGIQMVILLRSGTLDCNFFREKLQRLRRKKRPSSTNFILVTSYLK
ncbi:unnamed protein product [Orchesella dallaii]|uniref:Uncharacterized protein n=1 Tax=Orchesella dallaii TaxID=48710 RepID=A0ABP1RMY7_9HEXA